MVIKRLVLMLVTCGVWVLLYDRTIGYIRSLDNTKLTPYQHTWQSIEGFLLIASHVGSIKTFMIILTGG